MLSASLLGDAAVVDFPARTVKGNGTDFVAQVVAQNKVANWLTKLPKAWTCVQESCQLN